MSGKTFRQIAEEIGKSIGYVSDIEAGRKNPPEESTVQTLERFLGIRDGRLTALAREVRAVIPSNLNSLVQAKPILGDLLLRGDEMTPDELDALVRKLAEQSAKRREEANRKGLLFLNASSMTHL